MDDSTRSILQFINAANLLEKQDNLEDSLREVASLTAQILKTRRCSVMLLSEPDELDRGEPYLQVFAHHGNLPQEAYGKVTRLNEGIAGYVAATAKSLLIEDITQSQFASAARYPEKDNRSLMSAPILLGKQVIGTLNVSHPMDKTSFEGEDLEILEVFALFVGKSIHIAQLQGIMRSQFVEMAVVRDLEERNVSESMVIHPNPTKVAKIVAKSFFRELTKAGFGPNQIIEIATEVLNLLQKNLNKFKKRITRDDKL